MNLDRTALYLSFALNVRTLCELHNASVTSWWRSKKRNQALKGHPRSFHLQGLAADLVPDDLQRLDALARDARLLGLDVELSSNRVHIELDTRA